VPERVGMKPFRLIFMAKKMPTFLNKESIGIK